MKVEAMKWEQSMAAQRGVVRVKLSQLQQLKHRDFGAQAAFHACTVIHVFVLVIMGTELRASWCTVIHDVRSPRPWQQSYPGGLVVTNQMFSLVCW